MQLFSSSLIFIFKFWLVGVIVWIQVYLEALWALQLQTFVVVIPLVVILWGVALDQGQDQITIWVGNAHALSIFGWTGHKLTVIIFVTGVEAEVETGGLREYFFGNLLLSVDMVNMQTYQGILYGCKNTIGHW